MWGSAIYIVPVLEEDAVTVEAYFPESKWYDWYNLENFQVRGRNTLLDAPLDKINVFIRGGNIVPTQDPEVTTTLR